MHCFVKDGQTHFNLNTNTLQNFKKLYTNPQKCGKMEFEYENVRQ